MADQPPCLFLRQIVSPRFSGNVVNDVSVIRSQPLERLDDVRGELVVVSGGGASGPPPFQTSSNTPPPPPAAPPPPAPPPPEDEGGWMDGTPVREQRWSRWQISPRSFS